MLHVNIRDDINPTGKSKIMSTIEQDTPNSTNDNNNDMMDMFPEDRDCYTNHKSMTRDDHVESTRGRVRVGEVWNHAEQSYVVKGWRTMEDEEPMPNSESGDIACFFRGQRKKRKQNTPESDDECSDEEEDEQLVCSMTGRQWESLPFPIVIDSGACASVLPTDWCSHVSLLRTPQSDAKEFFRAANGKKIYNEGQKLVTMMTKEGAVRDMSFTACSVTRALGVSLSDVPGWKQGSVQSPMGSGRILY